MVSSANSFLQRGHDVKNNATPYILPAVAIISYNIAPLLILSILSLLAFLPLMLGTPHISYFALTSIVLILAYPLVLGQYSEITLYNRQVPYSVLFKKHWVNFIIVGLILNIPTFIIDILASITKIHVEFLDTICSIVITSLAIYIFPLMFIRRQKWQSVKFGIMCTLGNFKFSIPLILIATILTVLGLLMGGSEIGPGQSFQAFTYACFLIVSIFGDFIVFVSATLILKEKLLTS